MQYVDIISTAELMALQENWSSSHLLLPACPQSSNGERENIVSTAAFVAHFLSNTTCNESQSFITHTDFKSVYKQISNHTWTGTHSHKHIPKYWWSAIKLPVSSQRDKVRQRGELAKEDERRLRRKRSKMQKVKVYPAFQLVSLCHVSDWGSDWNQ